MSRIATENGDVLGTLRASGMGLNLGIAQWRLTTTHLDIHCWLCKVRGEEYGDLISWSQKGVKA